MESSQMEEPTNLPPTPCLTKGHIRMRYVIMALTCWAMFVSYSHRVNLSVAIVAMVNHTAIAEKSQTSGCPGPNVTQALDGPFIWDEKIQGFALGAFFYGYTVTQIPGGRMAETLGGKWLLAGGLLITSLATLSAPAAAWFGGAQALGVVRILTGLGEGVTYPAIFALLGRWAPIHERSIMLGLTNSGSHLGTVVTLPVAATLCGTDFLGGWPAVFYITGAVGLVWFLVWSWVATSGPENSSYIHSEELKYIEATRDSGNLHEKFPLKRMLLSRPIWVCSFLKFCLTWAFITLLTHLPHYMAAVLRFPLSEKGYLNAIPYIVDAVVTVAANYFFDVLRKRDLYDITMMRKTMLVIGCTGAGLALCLVPEAGCNGYATLVLFTVALGFYGILSAGDGPLVLDIAPDFSGTVCGIANAIANSSGMFAPIVAGILTNNQNDILHWSRVFYLSTGMMWLGTLVFLIWGTAEPEPWAIHGAPRSGGNPESKPLLSPQLII